MSQDSSKQRIIAIAAVIVFALLAVNAFLLWSKMNADKEISEQRVELDESNRLYTELEKQYYEALNELEEMRGSNTELNALIDQQQQELKDQKDKIARMIRTGRKLDEARTELDNLRGQVAGYVAEIDNLKAQNAQLSTENTNLRQTNTTLETDLTSQRSRNEELSSERAVLVSDKERLEGVNTELSNKVTFASVVKVGQVEVTPFKIKNNGKPADTRRAEKADLLQVCFNTTANPVTEAGRERFYVRILNPRGETLAIESMGSGLMNSVDGEELRFTQVKESDYTNEAEKMCFDWKPGVAFESGDYKVEVYNKGYLAGTGMFSMK